MYLQWWAGMTKISTWTWFWPVLIEWFKMWQEPSWIAAFATLDSPGTRHTVAASPNLICRSGDSLALLKLDQKRSVISRTLSISGTSLDGTNHEALLEDNKQLSQLNGTPQKVLYSKFLDLLIVAFNKHDDRSHCVRSSLKFLNLTTWVVFKVAPYNSDNSN